MAVVYPEGVWYTYVDDARHRRDRRVAPEERQGGRAPADAAAPGPLSADELPDRAAASSPAPAGAHRGRCATCRRRRAPQRHRRDRASASAVRRHHGQQGGADAGARLRAVRLDGACASTSAASAPARARTTKAAARREDMLARGRRPLAPQGPLALAGFSFGAFVHGAGAAGALDRARHRQDRAGRHGRVALRGAAAARPRRTSARWWSTASRTTPCRWPPCWTGRGRSHFRLRSFPGASHFFHGQLPLLKNLVVRHLRA